VLWQDGEPFTAKDVAATISFLKEHRVPRFWDAVSDVEAVTVKGNHEITITMKNTSYWHLHQIGGLPILPAWQLASLESWQIWQPIRMIHPQKRNLTMLVGTGPFVFSEYRQGEYVRLVRNDLFWLMSR
jgi:peptide/nickel transport system substrate-binding protein